MDAVLETDNNIEDLLLDDGFSPAPGGRSKPARIHKAAARVKGRHPRRKKLWILLVAAAARQRSRSACTAGRKAGKRLTVRP